MARIFIAFFNGLQNMNDPSVMPCFYECFIKELACRGNTLLIEHHCHFGGNFGPIPHDMKEKIENFSPDFAIIFNNAFYDLSQYFDFPIYVYEVDSIEYYSNIEVLKRKKDRFRYIVPQSASIDVIHNATGVAKENILYLPLFTSVRRETLPKTMNISFIGTRFLTNGWDGVSTWSRFMASRPSPKALEAYKSMLDILTDDPFIDEKSLYEKIDVTGIDIRKFLNKKEHIAVLSGSKRVLTLSAVSDLGLTIFGTPTWASENCVDPNIPLSFNFSPVYSLRHNQDIYNASKLAININHIQAKTGFSWRVCDIMASDACLVSEYRPDFDRHFAGVPIPLFHDRFEARELCRKLLESENMRQDIVERCNEVIERKFRFKHLVPQLEYFVGVSLRAEVTSDEHSLIEAFKDPLRSPPAPASDDGAKDGGKVRRGLLAPLKLKKRWKLFWYLLMLAAAQMPVVDLALPRKRREKLYRKIQKYWR